MRSLSRVSTMTNNSHSASESIISNNGILIKFQGNGSSPRPDVKVCIIGAGVAGLASARHLKDQGISHTVFEASHHVGGTWYYEPRVGTDEFGTPLITSMYKHLRTNLPKVTMTLSGVPMPDEVISFPPSEYIYYYLVSYAKHFELEKNIQFGQFVESVTKVEDLWRIIHKDVKTKETHTSYCEYVYVCNGHHNTPRMPKIKGEDKFKGTIIHSRDYRVPDPYKDRRVLIIGYGPSGNDIGIGVAGVSKTLFNSHHRAIGSTPYPENYIMKPDVKEFNETGAVFVDGSYEDIDDVIYCTGFDFTFPFLDSSSGLTLSPVYVTPLYKRMVNINEPTMLVLGLYALASLFVGIDAQARYASALVKGNFTLPSKEDMMKEWQDAVDELNRKGKPLSDLYYLNEEEDSYYASLSKESGTERAKPVMAKIRHDCVDLRLANLYTYRNYEFTIIDDYNYEMCYKEPGSDKCISNSTSLSEDF